MTQPDTLALLPGASVESAVSVLTQQMNALSTVRQGTKFEVHSQYMRWATEAANRLRTLISSDEVAHLILTQRHWVLCGIDPAANEALLTLVYTEIDERREAIQVALDGLARSRNRWTTHRGTLLVPDSNVLIHHKLPLEEIDWSAISGDNQNRIVIPILVVDELDKRKRDRGNTRSRAQATLRTLKAAFEDNPQGPAPLSADKSTDYASMHLLLDPPRHTRMPDNDRELIDRAIALSIEASRPVTLVTFDIGMTLRARADGLKVAHPHANDERED